MTEDDMEKIHMEKIRQLHERADEASRLSKEAVKLFFGEGRNRKVAAIVATRLAAACCHMSRMSAHTSTDLFLTFYKDAQKFWDATGSEIGGGAPLFKEKDDDQA